MKIAVEGCSHGELDNIYESLRLLEKNENIQIDLLICCGDFQASRNEADLFCMAVPEKYRSLCTFYKYYNGEKIAPILTIFIGGNHEASNYLQELPYGGWVAPNIFYLGYAGVINIAGVRIAGLSGIYKAQDYRKGHFEIAPYNENTKRSVYHVRSLEVFRLKQLSQPIDIFLSHDWPTGITNYGNRTQLMKFKPFFQNDIESGKLGSPPDEELLHHLKPSYWFAAHLHCKFAALVPHADGKRTKFLSLDKCLPKRRFLQILDVDHDPNLKIKISYDLEWLSILHATNHLLSIKDSIQYMPGPSGNERWCFTPMKEEEDFVLNRFEYNLVVPQNFAVVQNKIAPRRKKKIQPPAKLNPQTVEFCEKLSIDDPVQLLLLLKSSATPNETEHSQNIIYNVTKSFIEDSQVFEDDEPEDELEIEDNSPSQPEKLKLPEPKYTDEDDSATGGELSEENIIVNNLSLEEVCKTTEDKLDDVQSTDLKDGCESDSQEMHMNKKIKRRNAEIYNSED